MPMRSITRCGSLPGSLDPCHTEETATSLEGRICKPEECIDRDIFNWYTQQSFSYVLCRIPPLEVISTTSRGSFRDPGGASLLHMDAELAQDVVARHQCRQCRVFHLFRAL